MHVLQHAGAAQLALQSPDPVPLLREKVTSKGGTTYAALTSMEAGGVKAAIVAAVKGAAALMEFFKTAFNATERSRTQDASGRIANAEMLIGDSIVMIADQYAPIPRKAACARDSWPT